jgi:hypothetical protein
MGCVKELLDMCLADDGVKRMDPEILASILQILTTAVGSYSVWSLGRHAEMRRVIAQAVHLPRWQVINQLASLMDALVLSDRHNDDVGDELAKYATCVTTQHSKLLECGNTPANCTQAAEANGRRAAGATSQWRRQPSQSEP